MYYVIVAGLAEFQIKRVQDALFKLGGKWADNSSKYSYLNAYGYCLSEGGKLSYWDGSDYTPHSSLTQLTVRELMDKVGYSYPNPPHKHAEVIKAWADGAVIQYLSKAGRNKGEWVDSLVKIPSFFPSYEYRIKPEKTEVELKIDELEATIKKAQEQIQELKESSSGTNS